MLSGPLCEIELIAGQRLDVRGCSSHLRRRLDNTPASDRPASTETEPIAPPDLRQAAQREPDGGTRATRDRRPQRRVPDALSASAACNMACADQRIRSADSSRDNPAMSVSHASASMPVALRIATANRWISVADISG